MYYALALNVSSLAKQITICKFENLTLIDLSFYHHNFPIGQSSKYLVEQNTVK